MGRTYEEINSSSSFVHVWIHQYPRHVSSSKLGEISHQIYAFSECHSRYAAFVVQTSHQIECVILDFVVLVTFQTLRGIHSDHQV